MSSCLIRDCYLKKIRVFSLPLYYWPSFLCKQVDSGCSPLALLMLEQIPLSFLTHSNCIFIPASESRLTFILPFILTWSCLWQTQFFLLDMHGLHVFYHSQQTFILTRAARHLARKKGQQGDFECIRQFVSSWLSAGLRCYCTDARPLSPLKGSLFGLHHQDLLIPAKGVISEMRTFVLLGRKVYKEHRRKINFG